MAGRIGTTMTPLLPPRFLFRYTIPVHHQASMPGRGAQLLSLPPRFSLPNLATLDGQNPFAEVRVAWNSHGLGLRVLVQGKKLPAAVDPERPESSDGLHVWLDTRPADSVRRATRFCHRFAFLPPAADKPRSKPSSHQLPIPQARGDAPSVDLDLIELRTVRQARGYRLDVWLPAACLHGFDPEASRSLGFQYVVVDSELGNQSLIADEGLPADHDPSLWVRLQLQD